MRQFKTFADLFDFTRNGSATYWGADGTLHTAGPDELRYEYDSVTGTFLGTLIEGATATNLLSSSDESGLGSVSNTTIDEAVSSVGTPLEHIHPTVRHIVADGSGRALEPLVV